MTGSTSSSQTVAVAASRRYDDASRIVARVVELGFPEGTATIVGRDVRRLLLAEPSRDGRRAGVEGAASGGLVGGLVAAVLWLADALSWGAVAGASVGVLAGCLVGALVGWAVHALRKDEQRLVLRPTRFDVMTDVAVADEVAQALNGRPQAA